MRRIFGMALGFVIVAAPVSPAGAADLAVRSGRTVVHHHRAVLVRVVRDYDGTPITMRRRPDGIYETHVAMRASPTRYLNGQRVRP